MSLVPSVVAWFLHAHATTIDGSQATKLAEHQQGFGSGADDAMFAGNMDNHAARRASLQVDVVVPIRADSIIHGVILIRGDKRADPLVNRYVVAERRRERNNGCGLGNA